MVFICPLLNSKHKIPQPSCSMKTLKIRYLVFNLFRLVIIFLHGHVAPLAPLYEGPHKALSRSLETLQLQVGKRVEVVSLQRLKPAFSADYEAPEAPPRRGRPPPMPTSSSSSNPPRCRGRPRKVVTESSAITPQKRKKVTFKLNESNQRF